MLAGAVVIVVLVAAAVTVVVGTRRSGPQEPVVLPTPTPTVEPAGRAQDTAFQRALPDTVLAFVVADQALDGPFLDAGAVEAYHVTYTDGDRDVELRTGQWPTREAATERLEALLRAADEPATATPTAGPTAGPTVGPTGSPGTTPPGGRAPEPRDEPVLVDGEAAGRVVIGGEAAAATAVWTNGSTVFVLTGPGDVVPALYDAYPM